MSKMAKRAALRTAGVVECLESRTLLSVAAMKPVEPVRGSTPGDDGYEINDDILSAADLTALSGEQTITPLVCFDDDFYRIHLYQPGTNDHGVSIGFFHASGDLDLALYDAGGNLIDSSTSASDGEIVSLSGLDVGDYYVQVYGYSGATNSYSLGLFLPESTISNPGEPNDSLAQATDLGTVSGAVNLSPAAIATGDDQDIYKFITSSEGTAADFVEVNFTSSVGDLDIALYDADGTLLAASQGTVDNERVSLTGLSAGTYYLQVYGYGGATNSYTGTVQAPTAAPGGSTDSDEPNDSTGTATSLGTVSGTVNRPSLAISSDSDLDFFSFVLSRPGTSADFVRIDFAHSYGDLDMRLLNSGGGEVAKSDGTTDGEQISLNGLAAGTYFVEVHGYNGALNDYTLTASVTNTATIGPDSKETVEPVSLNSNQTLTNLSIHNPADNGGSGTQQDRFSFTTLGAGTVNDYVQISFSNALGDINLTVLDAGNNPVGSSNTTADVERISLSGLAAGVYTIVVDGAVNPNYSLTLSANFTAPGGGSTLPEWTVLVYVNADNNLEDAGLNDINEMEASILPRDVQLGVLIDRSAQHDTSDGNWTEARRGVIRHDSNPNSISSSLESLGELNMGASSTLSDFLSWGITNLPAQNYAVVLWDHGGATLGVSFDDASGGDALTPQELRSVISASPARLALVGFDACLMATGEIYNYLAGTADVMVASEEVEGNDGWDYTKWLDAFSENPNLSPAQLGSLIVQTHRGDGSIETQSAVGIATDTLTSALRSFADSVIDSASDGDLSAIISARDAATAYEYAQFHDLGEFLQGVIDRVGNNTIKTAATNALSALEGIRIANYSSTRKNGTGLSIYLPGRTGADGPLASYSDLSTWLTATRWGQLVNKLLGRAAGAGGSGISADLFENNNVRSTSHNFGRLSSHDLTLGSATLDHGGDIDWYKFSTVATGAGGDAITITFNNASGNLDLGLFNASGAFITSSIGDGNTETIGLAGLAAGTYFINVFGRDGNVTNDSYTIEIDAPAAGSGIDWAENNNTAAKAVPLADGSIAGGLTATSGDVDFFSISPARLPETTPLRITARFSGSPSALTMQLLDSDQNVLATGTPTASGLEIIGNFPSNLFVKVTSAGGASVPYSLTADHLELDTVENVAMSISDAPDVNETDSVATFTVTLDAASADTVTVDYATSDVEALGGVNYISTSGTLAFAPGETSKTISIPILFSPDDQPPLDFTLTLSNPSFGVVIADAEGRGRINSVVATPLTFAPGQSAEYAGSLGTVTLSLSRAGNGVAYFVTGQADPAAIFVTETTTRSTLTIGGDAVVGHIEVDGPLSSLSARDTTVTGNIAIAGTIRTLTTGDIADEHTILIGGEGVSTTIRLGNVSNTSIFASSPISRLTFINWTDDGEDDVIVAPTIGTISTKQALAADVVATSATSRGRGISSVSAATLNDVDFSAEAGSIGTIKATSANGGSISAVSLSTLDLRGDYNGDIVLNRPGATALSTARIRGNVTGGTWDITGNLSSITGGSFGANWQASVNGAVSSLISNADFAGQLTATNIRTLSIKGNMTGATVISSGDPTALGSTAGIRTLTVSRQMLGSTVRSVATIRTVNVGEMIDSNVFAGAEGTLNAMPGSADQLSGSASINTFNVKGIRGSDVAFSNSVIAAPSLGSITIRKVNFENGNVPFGVATREGALRSFRLIQPGQNTFSWTPRKDPSLLVFEGDLQVNLL